MWDFSDFDRCRNGRVIHPELLGSSSGSEVTGNIEDLARINRWLGGRRILENILRDHVSAEAFSILDVGAGGGDMAAGVRRRFREATVVSLDHRVPHLTSAPGRKVAGDAFQLPFADKAFDFVFCSLLLHEYGDGDVVRLLRQLFRVSRRAFIALDLYRHPMAYHFLPATRRLFGWSRLTLHDGPVSVEAAFLPSELEELARRAGLGKVVVRRRLPWFRVSLVAER